MVILDPYALVALLADEPPAAEVEALIRERPAAISAVNLAESLDVSERALGASRDRVRAVVEPLLAGELEVLDCTAQDAWRAASLRSRYYDRRERPISLAECFLLAAAGDEDDVATADPAVAEVARAEGIGLVALPDGSGKRP
jgi:PIN domain nuclease of toxin-antitoxin system